jgi:hypothetical protein
MITPERRRFRAAIAEAAKAAKDAGVPLMAIYTDLGGLARFYGPGNPAVAPADAEQWAGTEEGKA